MLTAALVWLAPRAAYADESLFDRGMRKIKSDDFRVRMSGVFDLAATNDDRAADPVCGKLSDNDAAVRTAAAIGLRRLKRERTLSCLKARESAETDEGAKVEIARAIESLASGGGGGGDEHIKENPNAKYYISLSTVANATGRAQTEVEKIVLNSIRGKLDSGGSVQLAPSTESADRAKEVIKSRKMKGFYLSIAVDRFDYADGNLRVKVKLTVCGYPNKAIIGTVDKTLTAQGVSSGDHASEDRLLELAAGLASEQFAQNASAFL